MKKYIKHSCKYWGHNYNKQPNNLPDFNGLAIDRDTHKPIGRWRKCIRCGHIDIVKGLLIEETVDIVKATLKDLPYLHIKF